MNNWQLGTSPAQGKRTAQNHSRAKRNPSCREQSRHQVEEVNLVSINGDADPFIWPLLSPQVGAGGQATGNLDATRVIVDFFLPAAPPPPTAAA